MKRAILFFMIQAFCLYTYAQNIVTYAGGDGRDVFYDVTQLSDGTFLVAGATEDLTWTGPNTPKIQLGHHDIRNSKGNNYYPFLLHLSEDFQNILNVIYLDKGVAENFKYIKTTNIKGQPTGDIYISGTTNDIKPHNGGYFIGKLNNNFVNGIPTDFDWVYTVWADGDVKEYQPWDVGGDGKVVFVRGQAHGGDNAVAYRLKPNGEKEVVNNWRTHWMADKGQWFGAPVSSYEGEGDSALTYSGVVFRTGKECSLRSWTKEDYETLLPDGNGGVKRGKWPLDAFFDSPCDPNGRIANIGTGYTGYSMGNKIVYGPTSVTIDRRTNNMFFGMNVQAKLPDGSSVYEPAVFAMDRSGRLLWWSRLHHEVTPSGDTLPSYPDQFVDGLAVDYSLPPESSFLVVQARCRGFDIENLREGDDIADNFWARGFQNRFTGIYGDIHVSWLGKLKLNSGRLMHSTYVAEYAEDAMFGLEHPDPNLDGWSDPNQGWFNVGTTLLAKNNLIVTKDGSVCIVGGGKKVITTANAFQKSEKEIGYEQEGLNAFVRVYSPDLSKPLYSSLLTGKSKGGNTELKAICKTGEGIVAVGYQKGADQFIPVNDVPDWGSDAPKGEGGILAYLTAKNIVNPADDPKKDSAVVYLSNDDPLPFNFDPYPNPSNGILKLDITVLGNSKSDVLSLNVKDTDGNILKKVDIGQLDKSRKQMKVDLSELNVGIYFLEMTSQDGMLNKRLVIRK